MGLTFIQFLKNVWGVEQSRGFRITSWGLALIGFTGYLYYEQTKEIDINKWNEKIKIKEIKEKKLIEEKKGN